MKVEDIRSIFAKNWVFWFFGKFKLNYILVSLLVSVLIWIAGAISALFAGALPIYIGNQSPYLHMLGFSIALIAFGWYINNFCFVLSNLSIVFYQTEEKGSFSQIGNSTKKESAMPGRKIRLFSKIASSAIRLWGKFKRWVDLPKHPEQKEYKKVVEDRANQIANNIWVFVIVSLLFAGWNVRDVIAIWTSPNPPPALVIWTVGHARIYFAVLYGLLHGVITSFLLGSGVVGLAGTLLILKDIFHRSLKLDFYRKTSVVIEFITWLIMWTLVGLSSVLVFGRPILFQRSNIPALFNSGIAQSFLGSSLVIALGVFPIILIMNAIAKAKEKELGRLEDISSKTRERLVEKLISLSKDQAPGQATEPCTGLCILNELQEEYNAVSNLIKQVKEIPNLPIQWGAILRVVFGAIISLGSSVFKKWIISLIGIK